MKKSTRHSGSAGFTLMELMIVMAVMGLIIVLALPKMSKAAGRTKILDAVSSLTQLAGLVEAKCTVQTTPPSNLASLISRPSGYTDPYFGNGSVCGSYTIAYTFGTGGLPKVCVQRLSGGGFRYGATAAANSAYTVEDVTANIDATLSCP